MSNDPTIIRGGIEGRERLRILAGVMRPMTLDLLERVGLAPGMHCLDMGCGGGDVTHELARIVGPSGHVSGIDLDETKLALGAKEAHAQGLGNSAFFKGDVTASVEDAVPLPVTSDDTDPPVNGVPADSRQSKPASGSFDLAYARFVLTHLTDPSLCIARMNDAVKPGGLVVVEDIDFEGHFTVPDCPATQRYLELYAATVRARGADPNIGRRLPVLLAEAGLGEIGMHVLNPAGMDGDVKLMNPITMETIAESVMAEGLATREEIEQIVATMLDLARDFRSVVSMPRIVQAWGRKG